MKKIFVHSVGEDFQKDENFVHLGVVGSRSVAPADIDYIHKILESFLILSEIELDIPRDNYIIVSGGAVGVDSYAESFAEKHNLDCIVIKPDWKKYGKKAGFLRNSEVVAVADVIVAFVDKDTGGTWDTIRKAEKAGKPVYIVRMDT